MLKKLCNMTGKNHAIRRLAEHNLTHIAVPLAVRGRAMTDTNYL
jgi:hypothetical protein